MLIRGFSLRLFSEALSVAFPMGLAPAIVTMKAVAMRWRGDVAPVRVEGVYNHSLVILRACPFTLSIAHDSR